MSQERIGTGIFSLWLQTEQVAGEAKPGQFINLYCQDGSRLLPRPISICEVNKEERQLRIVYRVAGKGTAEFSSYSKGDEVEILGPLGNGFPLDRMEEGKKAFLIAGGIGIPPMLELSRELKGEKQITWATAMSFSSMRSLRKTEPFISLPRTEAPEPKEMCWMQSARRA